MESIFTSTLFESFLPSLHAERLALDSSLSLPTKDAKYTSIISRFIENVVSLGLQCSEYGQIGLVVGMIKTAIAKGQASNLKHLICSIPNLYLDIIDTLCALFSLENFYLLSLDLGDVYPLMLSKLLQAFVTAPCPHKHKLLIHISGCTKFQMTLKENQVAAVDMKGVTIPSCGLQHKVLKFSSNDDLTKGMYILLQFPTIRLKDLSLFTNSEYLYLCAIHADFKTTKLVINVVKNDCYRWYGEDPQHITTVTLQQDLMSLLQISSLEKVCIKGTWGSSTEVKLGLVLGLQGRSHLSPLKKLSLELESQSSINKVQDFEKLCDALFSLPKLENLQLSSRKGIC